MGLRDDRSLKTIFNICFVILCLIVTSEHERRIWAIICFYHYLGNSLKNGTTLHGYHSQYEAVCYTIPKYAWRHKWQLRNYKWKENKCDSFIALLLCERVSEGIYRKLIFFFIFTFIELVNFKQNPINFRTKAKTLVICPQTLYIFMFEQYLLTIMMLTFIERNMVCVITPTPSDLGDVLGIPVTATSN